MHTSLLARIGSFPWCVALLLMTTVLRGQQLPLIVAPLTGKLVVSGQVSTPSGAAAPGAVVKLRMGTRGLQTLTDANGKFSFQNLVDGTYTVVAESHGEHSASRSVVLSADAREQGEIKLALLDTKPNPDETISFSDAPGFVISGVTDWTAAGGHGSDIALRTSEDLARATTKLQSMESVSTEPAARSSEGQLKNAVIMAPLDPVANLALGEYYLREQSWQKGLAPLQTAAAARASSRAEYDLAVAYHHLHDLSSATTHIQFALKGEQAGSYHRLAGEIAEAQGNAYAAVQHLQRATQIENTEDNYFAWASELLVHRAIQQAAEVFQQGLARYPKSSRLQIGFGSALFAEGQYIPAAEHLCVASDLQPDDPIPYMLLGKVDESTLTAPPCLQERLARFFHQSQRSADAHYLYAMTLQRHGGDTGHDQAKALLQQTIEIRQDYAPAYLHLGIMAAEKRDYPEAIALYQRAIACNPDEAETHFRLAALYERAGRPAAAKAERETYATIKHRQAEITEEERRTVKQFVVATK